MRGRLSKCSQGGKHSSLIEPEKNKEPEILISNEPQISKLIETCRKVEYGDEMDVVERKIWNYFNAASTSKTHSPDFKEYLEKAISRIENILSSSKDKFLISRIIKDCINEMKNDPGVVTGKLRQLYCVYEKLVKKITRLEETEVESDEDGGNIYIYLDRYRKKAVDVYNKICELEGRASDANRPTHQRFFFTGSTAPIPIQRALERYYNKTHNFPDFYDVKKLVKKVNKEETLNLSENDTYKTAESVFIEFGERLVCRRQYDDYNILVDYLKENQCEDPADRDIELQMKLEENKRTRKKEHEVLDKYAMQQACNSKKDEIIKANENKTIEEISTINLSSSSSSASSLSPSPASSDGEETEKGSESDDENSTQTKRGNTLFSDSEEELASIVVEAKRKRVEINELSSSKRLKTDKDNFPENDLADQKMDSDVNKKLESNQS